MSQKALTSIERFESLLKKDRRFQPEAYTFVYEALDWTLTNLNGEPATSGIHVTGKELLEGIRQLALRKFGPLTKTVFWSWGVLNTADWGEIVFNLIEQDLMGKQESDRKEDFVDVYDFSRAFDVELDLDYDERKECWTVVYHPRTPQATAPSRN